MCPNTHSPGYFIAIQQGADYVEPDLVISRDGALLARHENEIGGTTDVASHPEFAARKATKTIDGESITGWFTEDFTLAELKTLRARERLPDLRKANTRYDGAFSIPTFDEVLDLVAAADAQRAARRARRRACRRRRASASIRKPSIPSYFAKLGLHFDDRMLEALSRHGYSKRSDPICLQSFEVANLKALRRRTDLPLVQLVAPTGQPFDFTLAGDQRTYLDLMTRCRASRKSPPMPMPSARTSGWWCSSAPEGARTPGWRAARARPDSASTCGRCAPRTNSCRLI